MNQDDPVIVDRRNILLAAMMGGGLASLAGCAPGENQSEDDIWAGFDARITERTLAEAEKLFGLEFSASERQQILGGAVEEDEEGFFAKQVATLQSRRSYDIPNSLAPATSFDPRLPDADYSSQDNTLILYPEEIGPLPDNAESIAYASVKEHAHWMTTGQITSRELTEIYLERIDHYGDLLQCFVTVTPGIARAQAKRADEERA
ncbi:MAG: hypothetical protein VX236_04070, partial [Pseudomonadota bacterium]|nr:hypothetical protein [Pseudomonadota bacterium]